MQFDYFEDILSPSVLITMDIVASAQVLEQLPITGGEAVTIDLTAASGDFKRQKDFLMYVHKISNVNTSPSRQEFRLHLGSMEFLTNETARVQRKFDKATIDQHVIKILKESLHDNKTNAKVTNGIFESTSNPYSFIGTLKKPFTILQWLAPKGIPGDSKSGKSGSEAGGSGGFFFYENYDGYNFRSINKLVSQEPIAEYHTNDAITSGDEPNATAIMNHVFGGLNDLKKSLAIGQYANVNYFYNIYTNTIDSVVYKLSEEQDKSDTKLLDREKVPIPDIIGTKVSRIVYRTADTGVLDSEGDTEESGRDISDMSKSFSRYNLLFMQSLNIMVPMNVNLRVGSVIKINFQNSDSGKQTQRVDPNKSGNYLIKELRHHFEPGKMVTSLRLVRDSYGKTTR